MVTIKLDVFFILPNCTPRCCLLQGGAADSADQSTTSDEFDPSTVVRCRRDAAGFIGDGVDLAGFKRRAAELGYSSEDLEDEESWSSSEDEYIGLIPMLCARCMKCLRKRWFERRAKHFLVVFNVIFCVRIDTTASRNSE